jgi:type I restriction enzyme, S subunit
MTYLPSKWISTSLENLGEWGSGGTPQRTNPLYYQNGTIPWLIIGDLNDGIVTKAATHITQTGLENSSAKLLPTNTLLVAMYGSIGKLGITGIECATNQAIAYCKPYPELASLKYLFYALMNSKDELVAKGRGGAQQNINQGVLKAHKVHLAPFNEQKRIADKLDSLLTRVNACHAHLDRVPQILKRFRQSVLAAATSGKLTEKWREEYGFDLSDWNETNVSEIAEVFLGRQRSPENHYGEYMRKYVRAANITWNGWDFSDVKEMNFDPQDYEKYRLRVGDILLNEGSGSAGEVGKPAVWNGEIEDCCFQNTLICVRPHEASSKYLYFVFLYAAISGEFIKEARGLSIFHIGRERLAGFGISLPTLDEQHEIVRQVERLFDLADHIVARWNTAHEHTTQLVPSLLAKAFRGELVEQDLNDEPASELLKRITSTRENMPKEIKNTRQKANTKTIKADKEDVRPGVIQALKTSGKELSAQQLFQLAGYPPEAESELVEEFFVEVRNALNNNQIQKRRQNETDWFSLINQ